MDPNPFRTVRGYLDAVPALKWGAMLASVASAVLLVAILPLIFLTIDHLIWKGKIPSYRQLTLSRQAAFRAEWDSKLSSNDSVRAVMERLHGSLTDNDITAGEEWALRWTASIRHKLERHVGPAAADAYMPIPADSTTAPRLTDSSLGLLSLLARERTDYGTRVFAWFARLFPFTWKPDTIASANTNYLTSLFLAAALILLLHGICMLAADYFAAAASLEAGTRMRRTLYAHSTRLSLPAAKPEAAAEAAEIFTRDVEAVQDGIRAWLRAGIAAPVAFVLLLIVLFSVNPGLTLCIVMAGMLVWLVLGEYAAAFARQARHAARRSEARTEQMRESVSLLQLSKSYLMDRFNQTRLERQLNDYTRAEWLRLRGQALSRPLLMSATAIGGVGVLYLAGRSVLFGQLSMAGLATKIVAVAFLVWAVRFWISARVRIRRAGSASANISEFLERRTDAGQAIDAEFLQPLRKKLEVAELSLREPGTGRMLLEGVSFGVPAESRVAVVATSGEEARALLNAFGRFLDPTGGDIRIDGKNIRWVTLESLRTQVSLISQPLTVFTDTVANNIGCGDPSFPIPQVIGAAKLAHAHQFVQKLPYGYETVVGSGGYALRPGESMRIALARALLRDPSLIIAQEPVGLDVESQTLLDNVYERARGGRTLIVLSRREAVLRASDHVVVIHNGQVVLAGRHEDLMDGSDLYRRIVFREVGEPE